MRPAEFIAAVDINRDVLGKAKTQLGLGDDQLYTRAAQVLAEHKPDFITKENLYEPDYEV